MLSLVVFVIAGCSDPDFQRMEEGKARSRKRQRQRHRPRGSRLQLRYLNLLRWAPVHYQDTDVTGSHALSGKADYITAITFDGDWNYQATGTT